MVSDVLRCVWLVFLHVYRVGMPGSSRSPRRLTISLDTPQSARP